MSVSVVSVLSGLDSQTDLSFVLAGIDTKAIDYKMYCYKRYRQLNVLLQRVSLQRVSTTHADFLSNQIDAIFFVVATLCELYPFSADTLCNIYPL